MMKIIILALIFFSPIAFSTTNKVVFSHLNGGDKVAFVDAQVGEYIEVVIEDTCEDFQEKYKGLTKLSSEETKSGISPTAAALVTCERVVNNYFSGKHVCAKSEKKFYINNDGKFDGYQISLDKKDSSVISLIGDKGYEGLCALIGKKPKDITDESLFTDEVKKKMDAYVKEIDTTNYSIILNQSPWKTQFSGGIANSRLIDPQFYIHDVDGKQIIAKDSSSENKSSLIFSAFTHISNSNCRIFKKNCSPLALSAGIGASSGNELDYFLGLSWEFGPAFVTIGNHWGQVNRLKNGINVGAVVDGTKIKDDAISETNLVKKTDSALFLAVTFTFAGNAKATFSKGIAPATTTEKP